MLPSTMMVVRVSLDIKYRPNISIFSIIYFSSFIYKNSIKIALMLSKIWQFKKRHRKFVVSMKSNFDSFILIVVNIIKYVVGLYFAKEKNKLSSID